MKSMLVLKIGSGPRYKECVKEFSPNLNSSASPADTDLLRCMLLSRTIEERLIRLYHQGKIYGGVYTSMGQEGPGAAAAWASEPQDLFAPCIRNLSLHLGRGETTLNIFRQWLARKESPTRGRDGNIHFGNLSGHGVYAMISHLGAMLPVVTGGVMARRYKGIKSVGFGFIGDGGTSTGDFHEAVNFSAVQDVPVIFIVEDNHYAYSTPSQLQYRCSHLIDRAIGYGIEGFKADGNDAIELSRLLKKIADDIREKPRSVLVVVDTMRMRGHGEHDDFSYVPKELLEKYRQHDPIEVCRQKMLESGDLNESDWTELKKSCLQEVDSAYQQATREPGPDPSGLMEGVYESQ